MRSNWSDYEMYLKPVHLKCQAVTLTIVKATEEETHPQRGKSVLSPVLWFKEVPFGLILSPTNRQVLGALYGDRVQDCIGKPIVVKAVKEKVAGRDKEPIRIQPTRPNSPKIEIETGEIVEPTVTYPEAGEKVITAAETEMPKSELDTFFGPRATETPAPEAQWPTTEAEFAEWLKGKGINGKKTYQALGTDAKSWIKKHPTMTWADVARQVAAARQVEASTKAK